MVGRNTFYVWGLKIKSSDFEEKKTDDHTLNLATAGSSFAALVVIIVVIFVSWRCFQKKQRKEQESQADVNPVYGAAGDFEYDDMDNYDTMEESTRRKKEVKAEVVDRSSIYGENEEGWEDAVITDENPNYGEWYLFIKAITKKGFNVHLN